MNEASTGARRGELAGRGVLITRPREQAGDLSRRIEAAGGRAIVLPTLEIVDPPDAERLESLVARLDSFDLAIFVSPTAARRGLALIRARRELPPKMRVAAIGRGSARELQRQGITDVLCPAEGADSESLLALPELARLGGRSVLIVRGVGGREVLGDTLTQRGAKVEYAECYRRVRPQTDPADVLSAWARGEVHAATAMSSEALSNLVAIVGEAGREPLRRTPLFVPHPRIAHFARDLGLQRVVVADPGEEGMVAALIRYFAPVRLESRNE